MNWPWFGKRKSPREQLVLAWSDHALAYVQASRLDDGRMQVLRQGVERQGNDNAEDFAKRLGALGFKGRPARLMLRPAQYQVLQIDLPAVPPEELRAAARWQVREMVAQHIDDLTIDVLRVGDDQARTATHLFVVAAPNAVIREAMAMAAATRAKVDVIDVQDLAQRNLQTAHARQAQSLERAQAALVVTDEAQAVLTICANGELFYTRRIDVGAGFLQASWEAQAAAASPDGGLAAGYGAPGGYDAGYGAAPAYGTAGGYGEALGTGYGNDYGGASGYGDSGYGGAGAGDYGAGLPDSVQRLVTEIQRSLDLWDRTWSMLPLGGVSVQAGARSQELATTLGQALGQSVTLLDVAALFPGFTDSGDADSRLCWPLLGALLRDSGEAI